MNLSEIVSLIAALSILLGSIAALISAIGIVRFRDTFLRSHAATKSSTLSVLLTLTGVFIYFLVTKEYFSVRTLLTILFLYLTSPVAGHMIIRAAYNSGSYMYMKEFTKKGTSLNFRYDRKETKKDRRKRAEKRQIMNEAFAKNDKETFSKYKQVMKKDDSTLK
ncbi:Na+/H+ antiporter subunit G [Mammaliicoccus vitulinus]|uniref:Na+/H+ antiporter subunit G n=3 Tax=Mammaliicoccus vitulinus TaxID=71237 RepID=A0ABX7HBZ0_9STAP|nr:Na+/H+ antiporter subunit G [Mammaliicoccus vitulinus]HAL08661.1 cation:proton antiporter [Staphylococcus sp.]MBM6629695.1 Na+/H+ antiporter subunit G [Mammaliicoccus vitulinus]MBO3077717.1 Na+/H+ antiporter subunit G [Mammaliicoccus vitulinus]MEB7657344.1 Na+/H+ antiporter subunit G [Mammaliicoccus vitulinus]PNZ39825.1 cation:proton antiporter [Mammaliicoccus vitulinus]